MAERKETKSGNIIIGTLALLAFSFFLFLGSSKSPPPGARSPTFPRGDGPSHLLLPVAGGPSKSQPTKTEPAEVIWPARPRLPARLQQMVDIDLAGVAALDSFKSLDPVRQDRLRLYFELSVMISLETLGQEFKVTEKERADMTAYWNAWNVDDRCTKLIAEVESDPASSKVVDAYSEVNKRMAVALGKGAAASAMSHYRLGLDAASKEDFDSALKCFSEAIRLHPQFSRAYCSRGTAYLHKEDADHAMSDFNEAIRLDPKFAYAYLQRARAYLHKNNLDRALADCTEAIRLDPFADAYLVRSFVHRLKGNNSQADADQREAIRLDPSLDKK